ncbi:MAG: hypothetical protein ACK4NP_13450 [Parvularculaceae bacterium]
MMPEFLVTSKKIQTLMNLLTREAQAIAKRDWKEIGAITSKKLEIIEQLEPMLASTSAVSGDELKAVQKVARENAHRLDLLREGVARARNRIAELTDASQLVGVYAASGRPIRVKYSCANERDA